MRFNKSILLLLLVAFAGVASASIRDTRGEVTGNPSSYDSDLSSPFSIGTDIFGFPGYLLTGLQSISFTIPSLSNQTSSAITAQVYLAKNYTPDSSGTLVLSANQVLINGCIISVQAGFSGQFTASCNVTAGDSAKLLSQGIISTTSPNQSIVLGLGASAANLTFSSDGSNDSISMTLIPPPWVFVTTAGGPAPAQQTYPLPSGQTNLTTAPETFVGGNWLNANPSSPTSPSTLIVQPDPTGLNPGVYFGDVTVFSDQNINLFVAVTFIVLPSSARYIQQGPKLAPTGGIQKNGTAVSLSQDGLTAIFGAPLYPGFPQYEAAWIYVFQYGQWNYRSYLGPTGTAQTSIGQSVATSADGSVSVAGTPSAGSGAGGFVTNGFNAYVGTGATGSAAQGTSVAVSGDGLTVLVGGPADNSNAGAVWVFTRNGSTWTQQGLKLVGSGATGKALQGTSVALSADGNTAMIGGPADNSNAGAVWVFTRSGTTWTQLGNKITVNNALGNALFGAAVSLSSDGNAAIIGGNADFANVGAAWIFTRSGNTWQQGSKLLGTSNIGKSNQGSYVAMSADGGTVAIGGPGDNSFVGDAWVFQNNGGTWTQVGSKVRTLDQVSNPGLGPVSLSGDGGRLLVGGPTDNFNIGAAWVFVASGSAPTLTSINPTYSNAGAAGFILTVNGTNFLKGAAVQWGGVPLSTTFVGASQVTATVPANLLITGSTNPITVVNPDGTPTSGSNFTVLVPSLSITKTPVGNFAFGQNGAAYTVTVSNAANAAPTSGTLTVTDTLPVGMTLLSMSGTGWSCPSGGAVCTTLNSLAAGQSSTISVVVKIASNATSPIVNQVSVSGGGSLTASTSNSATLVTASPCDVNVDLSTGVADVQQMVNEVLGISPPYHDMNGDGSVRVSDVQIVANAVLLNSCK